jgi:DNA topoisomerase-1
LGIGRPSTYASILSTLSDRGYVRTEKNRFFPEDKGRLVTAFLENFFQRYVEYDFTADLEARLDKVSAGELGWKELLREFWQAFRANTSEVTELRVSDVLSALNDALAPRLFPAPADAAPDHDPRACPSCADGALSLKLGKFGAFIGCSNYPNCRYTRPFGTEEAAQQGAIPADGTPLGPDPDSGLMVTLRSGRFGPYVQLGEGDKPKRTSLPDKWKADELTLKQALQLLSLPREVGVHPEDGKPIVANLGRYGPYVQHDKTYANLSGVDEVFEVGLNRAVTLIAEKRSGARFKKAGTVAPLAELGLHPDGGAVQVFAGRYGPYVKHGDVNATVPKGTDPAAITLEQALELIAARAAAGGGKPKAKGRGGAKSGGKATAKTTTKASGKAPAKAAAKPATKRAAPRRAAASDSPA